MKGLTVLTVTGALLAVPSSAAAALEEIPFVTLPDRAPALCLAPTGVPGAVSLLGPYSRRQAATDLLTVGGDGVEPRERVEMGRLFECAAVGEAPGGAAVVAGVTVTREEQPELRAVVRDPGGAFGAPVVLSRRGTDAAAAVGSAGDAVVAWQERASARRSRIVAARRAPGGTFGAPETLIEWRRDDPDLASVNLQAAVDAAGTATLVWSRELASDDFDEHVEAATATRDGAFAVQRLGDGVSTIGGPVLATSPGGWALAGFREGGVRSPAVFERAPGGAFARVAVTDQEQAIIGAGLAVAVRDGGGAVVAWRGDRLEKPGGIQAVTRESAGAFGAVQTVASPPRPAWHSSTVGFDGLFDVLDPLGGPPFDEDGPDLRAALAADGRIVLAWADAAGRPPLRTEIAHAATGRLGGSFDASKRLGAPMREATDLAPVFLADGRAAVAWTDNTSGARDGRLHVAVEGAPALPALGAPRLTVRAPRFQRLYTSQSVRVSAACDRPCDLRALVAGPGGHKGDPVTSTRLRRGRRPLEAGWVDGVERGRPREIKVVVQATAPGGAATTMRRVRVRVARRQSLPLQRPLDVSARRDGDDVVVRWRTAEPTRRQYFFVAGYPSRDDTFASVADAYAFVDEDGRRRFRTRLRPLAGVRLRWVVVAAVSRDSGGDRAAVVRVR